MNYQETVDYLYSMLPMYQRVGSIAFKKDLTNTLALCSILNNPHKKIKTVHIAGTNGKGSVSHILAAIFQEAGYNTGLYTSPHLTDFRERIKINGQLISENYVIDFVKKYKDAFSKIKPSFFEMTVCLAFNYFKDMYADISIIETGMGGRFDSTNVITPELSVITNISFDHTQFLGTTLAQIAFEKAGIIKKQIPVVIGDTNSETKQVFKLKAEQESASIYFADEFNTIRLIEKNTLGFVVDYYESNNTLYQNLKIFSGGEYQLKNILTVLKSLQILVNKGYAINETHIRNGLQNFHKTTGLYGRWQIISNKPLVICDVGHNKDGILQTMNQLKEIKFNKLHFVFGMVNDKNPDEILSLLPQNAQYYFCKADIPRALDVDILLKHATNIGLYGNSFKTVPEAFFSAKSSATENDLIFIGGSTFVVGDFLKHLAASTIPLPLKILPRLFNRN